MMMLRALLASSMVFVVHGAVCPAPPAADEFALDKLNGTWFEIGKVQTIGGALIEGDCVCTLLDYTPVDSTDAVVANICREDTADGKLKEADATISQAESGAPGQFEETFCPTCPAVAYTIVSLDENSMVEYDCSSNSLGVINYCFHVMSRSPTMDENTLNGLQGLIDQYGLNPRNVSWKDTNQTGCGW
jgi:apolipoprotein D and lipocalin family protein